MGYGGKALQLPREGEWNSNGLQVMRVRFGYGDTARTAGGASDGCHVWSDTQASAIPLIEIAAVSSDHDSDSSPPLWGGVVIHDLFTVVKVAFVGLSAMTIGDCADSDGWAVDSDIVVGTTGTGSGYCSSVVTKPAYYKRPQIYATSDADMIKLNATADATAGIVDVYVTYSYVDKEPLPGSDWPDTLLM